jgi:peptidoglycan/LPS O-acetylase OafA/YrhL
MKQPITNPLRRHNNNFDLLRLAGALLVFFSHSYGEVFHAPGEMVGKWTSRYLQSIVGLTIFFTISGYLVTESLLKSASVKQYVWKRFLRIYPGYIVVTLLTVFILGPIFTCYTIRNYFFDPLTWKFLYKNILLLSNSKRLPGLFNGSNVNISAWTLPVELKLYGMLLILYMMRFFQYRWLQGLFFIAVTCIKIFIPVQLLQQWFGFDFNSWYNLGFFFIAGSTMYVWRDKIVLHYAGIILLAFIWWLTGALQFAGDVPGAILFVYSILYLGLKVPVLLRPGVDLSYGIYIYGSPVQATVSWLTKCRLPLWRYNLVVFPVTVLLGFLSWHLVEKKALALKNKVR